MRNRQEAVEVCVCVGGGVLLFSAPCLCLDINQEQRDKMVDNGHWEKEVVGGITSLELSLDEDWSTFCPSSFNSS